MPPRPSGSGVRHEPQENQERFAGFPFELRFSGFFSST
mgnify:CR=1 FL=1